MYKHFLKRILDFIISLIGFIFLLPVLLVVTILLFFANNGKPFFIQKRPGKNNKIFKIIKFRTMNDKKDTHGNLLLDSERLTRVGSYVRKMSLDELLQLINVIKGVMSLIGPRPLLIDYLSLYNEELIKRHNVLLGITGWAQINGRNNISWQKKFELDVWYVDHLSFLLDAQILLKTITKVIKTEGISSDTSVTMDKFEGNI